MIVLIFSKGCVPPNQYRKEFCYNVKQYRSIQLSCKLHANFELHVLLINCLNTLSIHKYQIPLPLFSWIFL